MLLNEILSDRKRARTVNRYMILTSHILETRLAGWRCTSNVCTPLCQFLPPFVIISKTDFSYLTKYLIARKMALGCLCYRNIFLNWCIKTRENRDKGLWNSLSKRKKTYNNQYTQHRTNKQTSDGWDLLQFGWSFLFCFLLLVSVSLYRDFMTAFSHYGSQ